MYLVKTPRFIQNLFPNFTWKIPTQEKVLYLTFDDGPIPDITPWVLSQLAEYQAKATFFVVGDNVAKHSDIFQQVLDEGHAVGNHTYNHLNGWKSSDIPYFHNVRRCARLVNSELFRPPYGKLKPKQAQFLQRHYNIVMWDVLSGDFDVNLSNEECYENVIRTTKPGSIVVFHDSIKAKEKLQYALPRILKHYHNLGYRFEAVTEAALEVKMPLRKIA